MIKIQNKTVGVFIVCFLISPIYHEKVSMSMTASKLTVGWRSLQSLIEPRAKPQYSLSSWPRSQDV